MTKEEFEHIKENVYMRCSVAAATGIGITIPDKEELELIDEIEKLNNILNKVRNYVKNDLTKYINPQDLLNILDGNDN